jgi:hypothetical protein
MTQEDAQLLYDWIIRTFGDPETKKPGRDDRASDGGYRDRQGI